MFQLDEFIITSLFILIFTFVYIYIAVKLQPFKVHKDRKISTISLKISYLGYLAIFLMVLYLFLFNQISLIQSNTSLYLFKTLLLLILLLTPNVFIYFRRNIKQYRIAYNAVFTGYNLIVVFYMLQLLYFHQIA